MSVYMHTRLDPLLNRTLVKGILFLHVDTALLTMVATLFMLPFGYKRYVQKHTLIRAPPFNKTHLSSCHKFLQKDDTPNF